MSLLKRGFRRVGGTIPIAGGLVAITAIAFALVVVQLSGTVSSGEFIPPTTTTTSTTTTVPNGDGLEAGVADGPGPFPCDEAITQGNTSVGTHSIDLNTVSAQDTNMFLCARNVGPGSINSLTVLAAAAQSSEVGCSSAEGAVDPDGPSCGSSGELQTVLGFRLTKISGAGACQTQADFAPGAQANLLQASLPDGADCVWSIQFRISGSPSDDSKLAASTDSVNFTLDVSGSG